MAWGWSHTHEAYDLARKNLGKKSIKFLAECYAEWACEDIINHDRRVQEELLERDSDFEYEDTNPYFDGRYEGAVKEAKTIAKRDGKDALEERIWERASERATCNNGGYSPWMCPEGCHTVEW